MTETIEWLAFAVFWIACGVLDYGITFAYFQRKYTLIAEKQYHSDRRHSMVMALAGPIGLLSTFATGTYGYGFKWK